MSHSKEESVSDEMMPQSTEVILSNKRKRYTPAFKQRLIEEADRCLGPGEVGALCRREGIYFSTLADFRKQKARSERNDKRQPNTPKERTDPRAIAELAASEREVRRLKRELERARALLDLQKKVSELMGLSLEPIE
jgi:transposase